MVIYVDGSRRSSGDGSKEYPFRTISAAAKIAGPGAAQGRYGVFSEGFGAVCHAQDPESKERRILSGGRRPDPGGRPCKERADLRSGVLCPEKGKKDKAGGFLVGIFCPRLAGSPAGPAFFVGILWETVRSRKKRK